MACCCGSLQGLEKVMLAYLQSTLDLFHGLQGGFVMLSKTLTISVPQL